MPEAVCGHIRQETMKTQNGLQSVFRHKPLQRSQPVAESTKKRAFHARQTHKKSRQGCLTCKKRRVKCDEEKPVCRNCDQTCSTCVFPTSDSPRHLADYAASVPHPNSRDFTLALKTLDDDLQALVGQDIDNRNLKAGSLAVFHHFNNVTVQQLGLKTNYSALLSSLNDNIWQGTAMLQMTLALASAHITHLRTPESSQHGQLAAAAHFQVALKAYRRELDTVVTVQSCNQHADILVTNTYLLTVAAFCMTDDVSADESGDIARLMQPIKSAGSLQCLMQVLPNVRAGTIWSNMLDRFVEANTKLTFQELPAAFVGLCRIEPTTMHENLHYKMLCYITPVLRVTPNTKQIVQLFAMIGDMWADIAQQLSAHDHSTYVLLAWWCALLHRLDVWWLQSRASIGCTAIVTYLETHGDQDTQKFLAFPASLGTGDYSWVWQATRINVV